MLSKKYRISKDKEYKKIFRKSKKFETENLSFRIVKRSNKQQDTRHKQIPNSNIQKLPSTTYSLPSRFGFVVSNKIDKRATRRNGLKRRLRAVIGEQLEKIKPGFDLVILVKKPFDYPYKFKDIEKQVIVGLTQTEALK